MSDCSFHSLLQNKVLCADHGPTSLLSVSFAAICFSFPRDPCASWGLPSPAQPPGSAGSGCEGPAAAR